MGKATLSVHLPPIHWFIIFVVEFRNQIEDKAILSSHLPPIPNL